MSGIDVAAVVDGGQAVPPMVNQADLVEIHRQLVGQAPRGDHWIAAAKVISSLSVAIHDFDGADPATVHLAVASVLTELRHRPIDDEPGWLRFRTAKGWIDNIEMQARAAKPPRQHPTGIDAPN